MFGRRPISPKTGGKEFWRCLMRDRICADVTRDADGA